MAIDDGLLAQGATTPPETPITADPGTPEAAPATDQPPAAVQVRIGQEALSLPPDQAERVRRELDRQAGTYGARLQALERQYQDALSRTPEPEPAPAMVDEPEPEPQLPDVVLPDRDLWATNPDTAARMLAEGLVQRQAAMDAHYREALQREQERSDAMILAAMRETGRVIEPLAADVVAQRQASERARFWQGFAKAHPTLMDTPQKRALAERVLIDRAQTWGNISQTEAAVRLGQDLTAEIAGIAGTGGSAPRTVTSSRPAASSAPAGPRQQPAPLSFVDLIQRRQQASRQPQRAAGRS